MQELTEKLTQLELKEIERITIEIARNTKKKRLTSGSMFFKQYCNLIAEQLLREKNRSIVQKFNLA
jgi:hypothetical protein